MSTVGLYLGKVWELACPGCGSETFTPKDVEENDEYESWICSNCGNQVWSDSLNVGELVECDIEGVPV